MSPPRIDAPSPYCLDCRTWLDSPDDLAKCAADHVEALRAEPHHCSERGVCVVAYIDAGTVRCPDCHERFDHGAEWDEAEERECDCSLVHCDDRLTSPLICRGKYHGKGELRIVAPVGLGPGLTYVGTLAERSIRFEPGVLYVSEGGRA